MSNSFTKAGSVSKSYGKAGEVYIKLSSDTLLNILDSKADAPETSVSPVFIQMDGILTPFFVEKCSPKGNSGFIVKFSTIRNAAGAEELVGKELYISDNGEDALSDLSEIIGYTVENENGTVVGNVADVIEYPANICLSIAPSNDYKKEKDSSEEVLIPFHPDLLIDLRPKEKRIAMKIAEGLL